MRVVQGSSAVILIMLNSLRLGYSSTDFQSTCSLGKECNKAITALIEDKIKEIESTIEERIWARIMNEPAGAATESPPENKEKEIADDNNCDIEYDAKCFNFILSKVMSFGEARSRCNRKGGHMANIYSQDLDNLIVDKMKKIQTDPFFIFIGMSYNSTTTQVVEHDGSPAGYVRWYSEGNFPSKEHAVLRFLVLPFASGMLNSVSAGKAMSHGVLCESQIKKSN